MGRIERNMYNLMSIPDLLFKLKVPIEVALYRNRHREKRDKETEDQLRERYRNNSDLRYSAVTIEHVDTSRDLSYTLKEIKKTIWANL